MGHPKFFKLLNQLKELHSKKSQSYANSTDPFSNYTAAAKFIGIQNYQYVLGRAAEKMERLKQLNQKRDGETIDETLKDIASLCLIASVMISERREG